MRNKKKYKYITRPGRGDEKKNIYNTELQRLSSPLAHLYRSCRPEELFELGIFGIPRFLLVTFVNWRGDTHKVTNNIT